MADAPRTPTHSAIAQKRARIAVGCSSSAVCWALADASQHDEDDDSAIQLVTSQPAPSSTSQGTPKEAQTNNARNQRAALEEHMMFLDKESARERNQHFINGILEILTGDRSSVTSQRTLKKIQNAQNINAVAMENTYVTAVFPVIIGESRTVKQIPPTTSAVADHTESPNPEMLTQLETVVREFAKDRLHWEGPCYFVKDLISGPRTKKEFGISDPRPDLGFGIRKKEMDMDPPKVSNGTKIRIRVAGCLDHCFCIFEAKGPDEPFAQATTQAIRGGASLVRARRELNKRAGRVPVKLGADSDSWVFTVAWMHGYAEIYVSWHESLTDGEAHHMHLLESYALKRPDDIQRFRRDVHNILDWGLDHKRVAGLEQLVKDIAGKEAAEGAA
ncbi:MAG: hypothetical protein LQ338_003552 [Usnochroma carphineum]|nr:MAG: hypothetical protein LQ338_003552 [Usnochroma carphineum]